MLLRSIAEKIRFVNEFFPSLEIRERGRFVNEFFSSLEMRERGRVSKSDMIVSGKRWLIDAVVEWPMHALISLGWTYSTLRGRDDESIILIDYCFLFLSLFPSLKVKSDVGVSRSDLFVSGKRSTIDVVIE